MKTRFKFTAARFALLGLLLATSMLRLIADPLGTAFTYSGRLLDRGNSNQPVNGVFEFQLSLFASPTDPKLIASVVVAPVGVTNGLFSVAVDFGANAFMLGTEEWIETGYRSSGSTNAFTILSPRQKLTAVPFAVLAANAGKAAAIELTGDFRVPGAGIASGTPAFIHVATAANTTGHVTTIDNPSCNGQPDALLLVTHNWSKDTASSPDSQYDTHPLGVYFNGSNWSVFHEDFSPMPAGRAFNVLIIKP